MQYCRTTSPVPEKPPVTPPRGTFKAANSDMAPSDSAPKDAVQPPLLLRAEEVAELLGLGRTKVYEMMASAQLPVVRIGTAVRVPRQKLIEWIDENTSKAA
jgi:excisionase family DNA binding protein